MEVILLERVAKLGQIGDVVRVKDGFARNFLLPRKKALRATEANRKRFEGQRVEIEARNLELKHEAKAIAEKLDGHSIVLIRPSRRKRPALRLRLAARHCRSPGPVALQGLARTGGLEHTHQGARSAHGSGASASGSRREDHCQCGTQRRGGRASGPWRSHRHARGDKPRGSRSRGRRGAGGSRSARGESDEGLAPRPVLRRRGRPCEHAGRKSVPVLPCFPEQFGRAGVCAAFMPARRSLNGPFTAGPRTWHGVPSERLAACFAQGPRIIPGGVYA